MNHLTSPHKSSRSSQRDGFSLVEMITTVGILGVLAAMSVYAMRVSIGQSKKVIANNTKETLNTAVHRFNTANYELYWAPIPLSGQDEMVVLRTIQYRDPAAPKPGAPYVRIDWNPVISNNINDYRLQWKGTLFALVEPGTAGYGLKVDLEGGDLGVPYTFPPNFSMAGK